MTCTFQETYRYLENARQQLRQCPVEDGFYKDTKPVREAFGATWLAIDTAIKAALVGRGLSAKQMPRSWDALLEAATRHLAIRSGKLTHMLAHAPTSFIWEATITATSTLVRSPKAPWAMPTA